MRAPHRVALLAVMLASIGTPSGADAAESFDNCAGFITSLPALITSQGVWCMDRDLSTAAASGNAITIATNNVTLDCNDYKLGNLAAGTGTQAVGVFADTRRNITVRGCNIRGFQFGVQFEGPGAGHVLEDNRIEGSTLAGLLLEGDNLIVRRNQVIDSGGTTATANAFGFGIAALESEGSTIRDNVVGGARNLGATANYGIIVYSSGVSVHGNTVLGDGSISIGITCTAAATGVHDNSIGRFTTPIEDGCVALDNHVF